jgi:translation initiation factor 2 subunit 1
LNKAIEQIKNRLAEGKGELVVKTPPRAVTARDDHSLSVLLEQLREQNKQVDGDELSDED